MNFHEIETRINIMDEKQCDKCKLGFDGVHWKSIQICPIQGALAASEDIKKSEEILKQLIDLKTNECRLFKMIQNDLEVQEEKLF